MYRWKYKSRVRYTRSSVLMDTTGTIFFTVSIGIVATFSCFGNFLLIYGLIRRRKFHSPPYVMICNQAVNDILMAGFVVPQKLHDLFHQGDYYEGKNDKILG